MLVYLRLVVERLTTVKYTIQLIVHLLEVAMLSYHSLDVLGHVTFACYELNHINLVRYYHILGYLFLGMAYCFVYRLKYEWPLLP